MIMIAGTDRPWTLDAREKIILTTLANQSAVAITNAQHYQEKEASEQRLSKIYEYSNDAIFVIDLANDAIIDVNRTACKMLLYSREQLVSMPVSSIHPLEMPKLHAFAKTVLGEGHGWTDELTCTTRTGQALPTEMSASVVEIEGRACIIAIVRDVSERREAQETLHQQMRELAVLGERNRISREIHDTLAQSLTGIIWQVNAATVISKNLDEKLTQSLERVKVLARESLQEARRAISELRPGSLENLSFVGALNREVNKVGVENIQASFIVSGEERVLPSGVEAALLRICQESLANVLKHAKAMKVDVSLAFEPSAVRLSVKDDGQGFAPGIDDQKETDQGGFGLTNMMERAHLLSGRVEIKSTPGSGTHVEAVLPLI
jgi:PAS domain S-box-containing protein